MRPLAWSRFCPACLSESAGRWLAAWRLPWFLVCPTHSALLANGCPHCGCPQRGRGLRGDYVGALTTTCDHPTGAPVGRRDSRCRHDLTARAPGVPAPAGLIALQAHLAALLDPSLSDAAAGELVADITDVHVVAMHAGLQLRSITGDRRDAAQVLAGPLVRARAILDDPALLRALVTDDQRRRLVALPGSWRNASPALTTVLLRHRDPRLRPTDRLRYRSMTAAARRPDGADPAVRLRAMPLALWADWAIRLRPRAVDASHFRVVAAAALCLPGATATLSQISGHWPPASTALICQPARSLARGPHGGAILYVLCALADTLARDGAPIDYRRRRTLAGQITLLDADMWAAMCRRGAVRTGDRRGFEPRICGCGKP